MSTTYAERVLETIRYLNALRPRLFPDHYATLRHALFLVDALTTETTAFRPHETNIAHELTRLSVQEFGWADALRRGARLDAETVDALTHKERAALLRGVVRSRAQVDTALLLKQVGISHTLDALVRDALDVQMRHHGLPEAFGAQVKDRFEAARDKDNADARVALLDIATLHHVPLLDDTAVTDALAAWNEHERLYLALLRHVGALRMTGQADALRELLLERDDLSLARRFALVNALVALDGRSSQTTLDHVLRQVEAEPSTTLLGTFRQYLRQTLENLQADAQPSQPEGLVIAQFMFMGRIGRAGKGNSGGLGVFLASLGDALADLPGVAHVYTLVLLNAERAEDDPPLCMEHAPGHTVVHVPICCRYEITQYHMMVQEVPIQQALRQVLATFHIEPDIFHIRYSDHGSRVATRVGRAMGKRVVFTLTTDPHRRLTGAFPDSRVAGLDARALTLNLQKVYLADQLVALADGLVAMPSASGTDPLKAYFPQLVLEEAARPKPLRMIAEGIQLLQEMPADETQDALLTGLCDVESAQQGTRLDLGFQNRPIMLNVGRLHPVKQQHVLVQAWAESGMWRTYNLVLIGGNFEHPTETEREIQARIDATFAQYPAARGRFCFLPAMPNAQVRALESAIIKTLPAPRPHVYACSSEKEEFGIAVLEAMDAGFLAFGPEIGGLSSYITPGENGFLIDTGSADSMAAALVEVLLGDRFTPRMLHDVAERGQQTVRERFDIRTTAKAFVDFYRSAD